MSKVFSINDFKGGLDLRKSPLTAPGGTLRILNNAHITQGGEIAKRLAFVPVLTLPPWALYIFGHGGNLHVFGWGTAPAIDTSACPVPVILHEYSVVGTPAPIAVIDAEAFDDGFFLIGVDAAGVTTCHWNGFIVLEPPGGASNSHGTNARTYKTKMYRLDGRYLRFSGVNAPEVNDPASTTNPGAGFINLATQDPDGEDLVGMEIFYDKMAVFGRLMTQLWVLDPDPTNDQVGQIIRMGTLAPRSVVQFGTGDILFLSDSGVRSLKSQTVTLTAAVSDVGSAIDPLLIDLIRANPQACAAANAVVQPIAGRYWLGIASTIHVLSYFPAGDITAWSLYTVPFTLREFAPVRNRVFVRGADNVVYLYGGADNQTYDSTPVTVRTPHMAVDAPTQRKRVQSLDVMCQGQWNIAMGMLPNNTEAFEPVATVKDNTFGLQSIPFAGYGTHIGLELTHAAPGPALLASVHLNIQEASTK